MDNKGVFTLDFLLSFLVIMVICGSLIQVTVTRLNNANTINTLTEARQLTEIVSSTINTIICNPNQTTKIKLPEKIGNSTYIMYIHNNEIFLEVDGIKEKTSFYPTSINGQYETNVYFQSNKTYKISSSTNSTGNIQIIEIWDND